MITNRLTHKELSLKKYMASLDSVKSEKTILNQMSNFGYTAELISEGQTLLLEAMKESEIEYNTRYEAYQVCKSLLHELSETYNLHREIAKVIFRKDDKTLKRLALNGCKPKAYEKRLESISKFYIIATSDTEVLSKLARLRLTSEKLESGKELLLSVEAAREHYINEKAKSKDATKAKNITLAKMADWMQEFYAVTKIAIEVIWVM